MRADAELALRGLGASSAWRPTALLLHGVAQLLLDEDDRADESLADAAEEAESSGATDILVVALAERSLLAMTRGDEAARTGSLYAKSDVKGGRKKAFAAVDGAAKQARRPDLRRSALARYNALHRAQQRGATKKK